MIGDWQLSVAMGAWYWMSGGSPFLKVGRFPYNGGPWHLLWKRDERNPVSRKRAEQLGRRLRKHVPDSLSLEEVGAILQKECRP